MLTGLPTVPRPLVALLLVLAAALTAGCIESKSTFGVTKSDDLAGPVDEDWTWDVGSGIRSLSVTFSLEPRPGEPSWVVDGLRVNLTNPAGESNWAVYEDHRQGTQREVLLNPSWENVAGLDGQWSLSFIALGGDAHYDFLVRGT